MLNLKNANKIYMKNNKTEEEKKQVLLFEHHNQAIGISIIESILNKHGFSIKNPEYLIGLTPVEFKNLGLFLYRDFLDLETSSILPLFKNFPYYSETELNNLELLNLVHYYIEFFQALSKKEQKLTDLEAQKHEEKQFVFELRSSIFNEQPLQSKEEATLYFDKLKKEIEKNQQELINLNQIFEQIKNKRNNTSYKLVEFVNTQDTVDFLHNIVKSKISMTKTNFLTLTQVFYSYYFLLNNEEKTETKNAVNAMLAQQTLALKELCVLVAEKIRQLEEVQDKMYLDQKVNRALYTALLIQHGLDYDYMLKKANTVTDFLRLATYFTEDKNGYIKDDIDKVSLIKGKYSFVNQCKDLHKEFIQYINQYVQEHDFTLEDFLTNVNIWKAYFNYFKLGNKKVAKRLHLNNKFKTIIQQVYKNDKTNTFNSNVESKIADLETFKNFESLLSYMAIKPTLLIKKLSVLLKEMTKIKQVDENKYLQMKDNLLTVLESYKDKISTKALLQLNVYLSNKSENCGYICRKSKNGFFLNLNKINKLKDIDLNLLEELKNWNINALIHQLSQKEELGNVYVEESLMQQDIKLSFDQTKKEGNNSLMTLPFGSKISLKSHKCYEEFKNNVLDFFIYWKDKSDLDLSLLLLDSNLNTLEAINYGNLCTESAVHSGDIRTAPNGASEIIRLTPKNKQIKYALVYVNNYSGVNFTNMEKCYVGLATGKNTGKIKPENIIFKNDLKNNGYNNIPFIYDLENQEIIILDHSLRGDYISSSSNNIFENVVNDLPTSNPQNVFTKLKELEQILLFAFKGQFMQFERLLSLNLLARKANITQDLSNVNTAFVFDFDNEEVLVENERRMKEINTLKENIISLEKDIINIKTQVIQKIFEFDKQGILDLEELISYKQQNILKLKDKINSIKLITIISPFQQEMIGIQMI